MSADARTSIPCGPTAYAAHALEIAQAMADPAELERFLAANRERHTPAAPIPVPSKPIAVEIEINPS